MDVAKRKIDCFIYSSPRSGSTVLRLNLSKVEGIVALPETHFFVFAAECGRNKLSFISSKEKIIGNWCDYHTVSKMISNLDLLKSKLMQGASSMKDIIEVTIAHYLDEQSLTNVARVVVEKSPPHIHFITDINSFYPEAQGINLVRDPRDVIASLKTCYWSTSNVYINACVWKKGIELLPKDGYLIIYEKMVENPGLELEQVANYLKLPDFKIKSDTIDSIEQANSTSKNSLRPISGGFVGGYKDKLSRPDRDVLVIESICQESMKTFGYTLDGGKKDLKYRIMKFRGACARIVSKLVG